MSIEEYIEEHIDPEPEELYEVVRRTFLETVNPRMCSGHLQGRLLKMIVRMVRPHRVLELGSYTGYSALCLAEGLPHEGRVDTVEIFDELEDFIKETLASSKAGEKVRLHIGDFMELKERVPELSGPFQLVYIDANKRDYSEYYNAVFPLVETGGFILADNTLWDAHVVDPSYSNDPQTRGIRNFNDLVAADTRVEKVILPLRDGLTLIYKKSN